MKQTLADALGRYRKWGFCIIPIEHRGKKPLVPWQAYRRRQPDNAEFGDWFLMDDNPKNIAIVCGKISGNLVVLDFDDELLFRGFESFWNETHEKPLNEMTPVVQSGGRGYHVYLRVQNLPCLHHPSGNARTEVPDVQSEGGYVVAPPSIHPSGKEYKLLNPDCDTIAQVVGLDDLGITDIPLYREPETKALPVSQVRPQSEEFNRLAVEQIFQHCSFLQHCAEDATALAEPHWWSMVNCLAVFGSAGAHKIHEISTPYPKYSERETTQKIAGAEKAVAKGIGPHTCSVIQKELAFICPVVCMSKKLATASPSGMASKLASQVLIQKRTNSVRIGTTKNGKQDIQVNCPTLGEELLKRSAFRTFRDSKEVLCHQDGVYRYGGESVVHELVQHQLLHLTSSYRVSEVLEYIKRATYVDRALFDNPSTLLNLENGLLDIDTGELIEHSPDHLSSIRIPIVYTPTATCPQIERFLKDIVSPDVIPVIEEMAGYCLETGYRIHRAFLLIGDGANGKSTLLELMRAFLGKENCSTVSLQALEVNRFAAADLYGKLSNMYSDLPSTMLKHVGVFKMLTGGDSVRGEKKFAGGFSFYNRAKLIFSSNKPPKVQGEDTYAFWRRWIIINFPHQFTGDSADRRILDKLTHPNELSGFLNLALQGLRRLHDKGDFSYAPSVDEVSETYLRAADPIYAFITERCEVDTDGWISKDDLYGVYKSFSLEQKIPTLGRESFGRALKNTTFADTIKSDRKRLSGDLIYGWKGITAV